MSADTLLLGRLAGVPDLAALVDGAAEVDEVDEVAAVLESAGVNDTVAAERFGAADVFVLAEWVVTAARASTPDRTPAAVVPAPVIDRRETLLRGAAFTVPGLVTAGLVAPGDPAGSLLGFAGLVLGWGFGQGLAAVGHRLRGRGDQAGARRVLRRGAVAVGGAWAAVVGLTVAVGGVSGQAAATALGVVGYLIAASVMLVLASAGWLLLALLPAVTGAVADAAGLAWGLPAGCAVTVVVAGGLAAGRLTRSAPGRAVAGDLRAGIAHGAHGACAATLLLSGLSAWSARATEAVPVAVALALSVVSLEWEFATFRHRVRRGLVATNTAGVRAAVRTTLAATVGRYLAVTALLAMVVGTVASGLLGQWSFPTGAQVAQTGWALAIGVALLLSGLLVASDAARPVLVLMLPTALATAAFTFATPIATPAVSMLAGLLAVLLVVVAARRLGRLEAHR